MTPDQILHFFAQTTTNQPIGPDQVQQAITDSLNQGGSQWLVSTIVAFLPVLWTLALMMHLGRPYVLRTLRRCGLRLGADVWWMSYLLIRDAVLLLTFALSWIFFQPNLINSMALPITGPVSALLLLLALAVKLTRRADDDVNAYRWTTAFLVAGASLYYLALVFGIEAASQGYLADFASAATTNSNATTTAWALGVMWVSLVGVVLVGAWLFLHALNSATRTMSGQITPQPPQPTQEQAATAQ